MPIFKSFNKVVYFSHIPRCGGSSVEDYLQSLALVSVAFLDRTFDVRYSSRTNSPQHMYGQDLTRLFPMDFFDDYFTVVRCPISRFQSAFYFNQTTQKTIDGNIGINEFISNLCMDSVSEYRFYDGHFAPQLQFLYPNVQYRVFRLEDGLTHVKMYIDKFFFGNAIQKEMPKSNSTKVYYDSEELSCESTEKLKIIYKRDFELLGYSDTTPSS